MEDCASEQVTAVESGERADCRYRKYANVPDHKMVTFSLGIFNCIIGITLIVLNIVLVADLHDNYPYFPLPYNAAPISFLTILKALAGDFGNFRSVLLSGSLLVVSGIAGIVTKTKPKSAIFLFSGLTTLLTPLFCIGTFGFHIGTVGFRGMGTFREAAMSTILVTIISLVAAGAASSITQSVFSFRSLLEYFEGATNSGPQHGQETILSDFTVTNRTAVTAWRMRIVVVCLGFSEIVCGLIIAVIQSIAAAMLNQTEPYKPSWLSTYSRIKRQEALHAPGIYAGLIVCISGCFGAANLSYRSVLNINMMLSMLAAACSCAANFAATSMLYQPQFTIPAFPWQGLLIAFSSISLLICITHSALSCKIQCQPTGDEGVIVTASAQASTI